MTTHEGRLICAWCGCDLGPSGMDADSHGICAKCKRKLMRKAKREKSDD